MKIERVRAFCALFLLAGLLTACGGGGGGGARDAPSATPLLAGNGADRALAALPNVSPTRAAREDIENGVLLSRISVVLKLDATVADVNAAAQAVGATAFAFARANSPFLTLSVARQANAAALEQLAARLNGLAGIVFADAARQIQPLVLPQADGNTAPTAPVSDLDHLLATRFPAAWNVRRVAEKDCGANKVTVLVPDLYFGLPPNFEDQMQGAASAGELLVDPLPGQTPEPHGYQVVGTIAAKFDAELSHGANPSVACLQIRIVDGFGYDLYALMDKLIEAIKRESGPIIVSSSVGYNNAELCPQPCNDAAFTPAQTDRLRRAIESHFLDGIMWAGFAMQPGVADRVLLIQAAGNDFDKSPGEFYAGLRSARFGSPFAIAATLDVFETLASDAALWKSTINPALPDLTLDTATVGLLKLLRDAVLGAGAVTGRNLLLVGSTTNETLLADLTVSHFSDEGASIFAVGENVSTVDLHAVEGTSFAAPQVAGLASYLWLLDPGLRSQPVSETLKLIRATSGGNGSVGGVIDAYGAVLALDARNRNLRIRKALLDVNGDGVFDALDLMEFAKAYHLADPNAPTIPTVRDYSRYDLNGDGLTGGITTARFDLDASGLDAQGAAIISSVDATIEGFPISMNEAALSDLQILCFYAYSPMYVLDPGGQNERQRTALLGPERCVGARMNVQLPAQIAGSAKLGVSVSVPSGNGQLVPAANLLIEVTPSCGSVKPASGRTDANGQLTTTITPDAACTSLTLDLVARANANTTPLVRQQVSAQVSVSTARVVLIQRSGGSGSQGLATARTDVGQVVSSQDDGSGPPPDDFNPFSVSSTASGTAHGTGSFKNDEASFSASGRMDSNVDTSGTAALNASASGSCSTQTHVTFEFSHEDVGAVVESGGGFSLRFKVEGGSMNYNLSGTGSFQIGPNGHPDPLPPGSGTLPPGDWVLSGSANCASNVSDSFTLQLTVNP